MLKTNHHGKKRANVAGFKAFSSEDTSFSYNPAHSDIVDASNMEAIKTFLDVTGATANPVAWCLMMELSTIPPS